MINGTPGKWGVTGKTSKIENNSRYSSELGIPISLTLKCHNLSLSYPNEMIPIPTKNRLI